ncbi:MAG: hypothetical protein QS748_12105, partial [Candidatus Endonucleobacter bathymodioli]|nr:hypothetical protein [Candidatus Endonucleobacter bathymodioli]
GGTIIHALSSTKNKDKKHGNDMSSTRRSNQYYFCFNMHIGTDIIYTAQPSHRPMKLMLTSYPS